MLYRVYNQGEIATLAHGWRCVVALTPGRKWVTLVDWTTLESTRLEIAAWEKLRPCPHKGVNPRKVRAVMRRRLKYVTPTRAIEEAILRLREQST